MDRARAGDKLKPILVGKEEKMKVCTQCKKEKSDADFIKMGMQRHSMCDPCRKKYQREYHNKRKAMRNAYVW